MCRPAPPGVGKKKLSFFEVVTALAFEYFRDQKVDYAVIEVGLGGRLDATNLLTPLVTVCTDISFDHVEILGKTLTRIAKEKAGIIKPGVPHVIGLLPPDAERVMKRTCRERKAPLYAVTPRTAVADKVNLSLKFPYTASKRINLTPSLKGLHQLKNTTVALKTMSVLRAQGIPISAKSIVTGIENTNWPGRFQMIRLPKGPTVVLDVCHNAAGARAFADTFKRVFPGRKASVILGVVKKKEHQEMVDAFKAFTSEFTLIPLKTHRSMPPRELLATVKFEPIPVMIKGNVDSAYHRLLRRAGPDDILVVAGSHYLVGEFLQKYTK
ncbi:MAG: cyanophycin synthetase [Candidatus Zixiibacteriota bacterium]